ncbi:UDP-2,4-diacetamido-2,4,6-trideoxy-beta-L-altropyranose hydrolase [Desulfobacterota bacterium M19]
MVDFKKQRLIIRADANQSIGVGHVMRCLALAQGWLSNNGEVLFVGAIDSPVLRDRIISSGCEFIQIKKPYPAIDDLESLIRLIQNNKDTTEVWVAVDGYHFHADYTSALRQTGARVLVIDDCAHQGEYKADILLNQNPGSENLAYAINPEAVKLLGNKYIMLRCEFLEKRNQEQRYDIKRTQEKRQARTNKNVAPDTAERMLITLGGGDKNNVTLKIIDALNLIESKQLEVKIVVGPANPHIRILKKLMEKINFKGRLITNVNNMAPLMSWADIAISAGGSTCWELAYMGVPSVIIITADNQLEVAKMISRHGCGVNYGWAQTLTPHDFAEKLNKILNNHSMRTMMTKAGYRLVDGMGSDRVVGTMRYFPFKFTPVTPKDCQIIFDWANDPIIRNISFNSEKISWENHRAWFSQTINNSNILFWIVSFQGHEHIGQVRFETIGNAGVISVSLDKKFRNIGLGTMLIKQACRKFFDIRNKNRIKAFIKADNIQSRHTFTNAGFKHISEKLTNGFQTIVMSLEN